MVSLVVEIAVRFIKLLIVVLPADRLPVMYQTNHVSCKTGFEVSSSVYFVDPSAMVAYADELVTGLLPNGYNHISKNFSFPVVSLLSTHFFPTVSETIRIHIVTVKFMCIVSTGVPPITKILSTPSNSKPLPDCKTGSDASMSVV